MTGVLRTAGDDVDAFEPERRARMDQECGLALVGFDERHVQLWPGDLDRQSREAGAGADVDQALCIAKVVQQHQTVLDERAVGPRHEPRPLRDQSSELIEFRILH